MGCDTLVLTMKLDHIALMPCNPSIGGPAKGHLAREVDALGGEMGRNTDKTFIQIRMLNTGKGPAVQALRAQSDKEMYAREMRRILEAQEGLTVREALVTGIGVGGDWQEKCDGASHRFLAGHRNDMEDGRRDDGSHKDGWIKLETKSGEGYVGRTVVLTTGTSLAGKIIMGERAYTGGRAGEPAASEISESLKRLGFVLGRHKTGTPPRLDARTIDFSKARIQPGSTIPLHFSFWGANGDSLRFPTPNPVYPKPPESGWRPQMACYLVSTNPRTHELITANLDRAPMFNGSIEGVGPGTARPSRTRWCVLPTRIPTACSWSPRAGRPMRSTCRALTRACRRTYRKPL